MKKLIPLKWNLNDPGDLIITDHPNLCYLCKDNIKLKIYYDSVSLPSEIFIFKDGSWKHVGNFHVNVLDSTRNFNAVTMKVNEKYQLGFKIDRDPTNELVDMSELKRKWISHSK